MSVTLRIGEKLTKVSWCEFTELVSRADLTTAVEIVDVVEA